MTSVGEIMSSGVVTIPPEATLADALRILTENHIGGAPVVSADGTLVGMISELALLDVVFDTAAREAPVADYMTQDPQLVHPADPLTEAAQLFALFSFRRLPVVEEGKLVGILSRRDLMNHAVRSAEVLTEPLFEMVPALGEFT